MATDIGTGLATNATNAIVGLLFQQLKEVKDLGENVQLLQNELARMDIFLLHIHTEFEAQQKKLPEKVEMCLDQSMKDALEMCPDQSMKDALEDAKALISNANRQRRRCLGCCLLSCSKIPAEIRGWKTGCDKLFRELESALSITPNIQQIVQFAQPQAEVLLQPLPESGFVGSGIARSERKVLTWLKEPHPQDRVIGVYGMAGVGKTSLLKLIYNRCKVSSDFDYVIWFTVSQNYNVGRLQDCIAESLNLDMKGISSIQTRTMKVCAYLESKRFILILDDLWSPIDLNQVGVKFGHDNRSRVLISSRSREVVERMAANAGYCMKIEPLSIEEGWELFRRRAFTNGAAGDKDVEGIAEKVALECRGLPLAINTVAAALAPKKTADEWNRALELMKNADPSFPSTHKTIDKELYQRLRWSYNDLQEHNLKMCFLYCAVFPEDARINVETLVEMWTAESLVPQKGTTYFMDDGREYIDALVGRCLIEYVDGYKKDEIKVHDVLRDMAIYIGQGDKEKWLFLAGQHLQNFPSEKKTKGCKRISVVDNGISNLPADLKSAPTLVSLVLAKNRPLKEIPESILVKFKSLKVLDLSHTSIQTLPTSVGQLGQLVFLNLSFCENLEDLPDDICNLSHLQFLNLHKCKSLKSLPARIGALKNLKHLQFYSDRREGVLVMSHQISQLTSLNKLILPQTSNPMSVEHLTNLSSLIELEVRVKPKMKGGSMSSWLEMRELRLWIEEEDGDDAAVDFVPHMIESMKKLQTLRLEGYEGVSLPDCIHEFQNLKNLYLSGCSALKELPVMEMGSGAASGGYPMLERLLLYFLDSLESIVRDEGTMLKLQSVSIAHCPMLKTLGIKELPNLKELQISECDGLESIECGCPMLETLELSHLERLKSIVWDERFTMSKLQIVHISDCPLLKTLGIKELPNLRDFRISHCDGLEGFESIVCPYQMLETLELSDLERLESI